MVNNEKIDMFSGFLKTGLYCTILYYVIFLLGFFLINSLPSVVPPSSTDSLKYLAIFFIIPKAFIMGFLLAGIILPLVGVFYKIKGVETNNEILVSKKRLITLIIFSIVSLFMVGNTLLADAQRLKEYNTKNTVGVKVDLHVLEKITISEKEVFNYDLALNKGHEINFKEGRKYMNKEFQGFRGEEFIWGNNRYQVSFDDKNNILFKPLDKGVIIQYSLDGYPWISQISYLPFDHNGKSYLFLLSRLRPTSFLSMVSVFDETGSLLYEELMDGGHDVIETAKTSNGSRVVILGWKWSPLDENTILYLSDFGYKIK